MSWRIQEKKHPIIGTWYNLQYSYESIDLNGKPYTQWATEKDYSTRKGAEKALARMAESVH